MKNSFLQNSEFEETRAAKQTEKESKKKNRKPGKLDGTLQAK